MASRDVSNIERDDSTDFNAESKRRKRKDKKADASTGLQTAGARALSSQIIAFYFRAPIRSFFRSRIDYMAYARVINPLYRDGQAWSWRVSTPALLAHAVKQHGWGFIPNQVLPPLMANVSVGAVLFTTYLQTLGALHEPSSRSLKRVYPPPEYHHTLAAGFVAGSVQSVFAAPLDALQSRFRVNDMLEGRYKSIWGYSLSKIREIGLRGIFAGWSMSFVKDSMSCALFFSTFEWTKGQLYYACLPRIYDPGHTRNTVFQSTIRPHYLIEPGFILAAGAFATFAQQAIQHPMSQIQNIHFTQLESLDYSAKIEKSHSQMMRLYYHAYERTFIQAKKQAILAGGWRRWLYKDFLWNTVRQTPSTSAGLIAFEILRRKYADNGGEHEIRLDGVPFLL